jgi:hypothetical protein
MFSLCTPRGQLQLAVINIFGALVAQSLWSKCFSPLRWDRFCKKSQSTLYRWFTTIKLTLKGYGDIFFIFSFEGTFKTIYNTLLPFFHILLTSTNISVDQYFIYRQPLIILHSWLYTLSALRNIKITQNLKNIYQSIFGQHATNTFSMVNPTELVVNPCCDVTKTAVNKIKNLSKMADNSLILQVKIFQEPSKIWKINR